MEYFVFDVKAPLQSIGNTLIYKEVAIPEYFQYELPASC